MYCRSKDLLLYVLLKVCKLEVFKLEVCDAKLDDMKSLCLEVHVMNFCVMKFF